MRKNIFEYSLPKIDGCEVSPSLRTLHMQANGKLWGTFLFSSQPLQAFEWDSKNGNVVSHKTEGLEDILGTDCLGIWAGARSSHTGDTVVAAWHRSTMPSFLNFFGKDLRKVDSTFISNLIRKDAGSSTIKHSILELSRGEWQVRRGKEPGVLTDISIVGDYVFGLTPTAVFREPYLKTEKREVLRNDLQGNLMLSRDAEGHFWFESQSGRLMRMGLTDLKPKMTPIKVSGQELGLSAASSLDGWLYVLVADDKQLVRIRINPVTFEEELQVVCDFEGRASALHVLESEESSKLLVAESLGAQGSRLLAFNLTKPEDPELVEDAPVFEVLTSLDGVFRVSAIASMTQILEGESPRNLVWLGSSPIPGEPDQGPLKLISLIDV